MRRHPLSPTTLSIIALLCLGLSQLVLLAKPAGAQAQVNTAAKVLISKATGTTTAVVTVSAGTHVLFYKRTANNYLHSCKLAPVTPNVSASIGCDQAHSLGDVYFIAVWSKPWTEDYKVLLDDYPLPIEFLRSDVTLPIVVKPASLDLEPQGASTDYRFQWYYQQRRPSIANVTYTLSPAGSEIVYESLDSWGGSVRFRPPEGAAPDCWKVQVLAPPEVYVGGDSSGCYRVNLAEVAVPLP